MEKLNQVLQSLSPYVVISLTGDPVKSIYASMWGNRSPMPTVWVNRFDDIIANIWDLQASKQCMVPPDHIIIFIDYTYRRMISNEHFNLSDLLTKENPDKQTVILIGNIGKTTDKDEKLCRTMGIRCLSINKQEDVLHLVRDKCQETYRTRCYHVDKEIKEILNAKLKTS